MHTYSYRPPPPVRPFPPPPLPPSPPPPLPPLPPPPRPPPHFLALGTLFGANSLPQYNISALRSSYFDSNVSRLQYTMKSVSLGNDALFLRYTSRTRRLTRLRSTARFICFFGTTMPIRVHVASFSLLLLMYLTRMILPLNVRPFFFTRPKSAWVLRRSRGRNFSPSMLSNRREGHARTPAHTHIHTYILYTRTTRTRRRRIEEQKIK